MIDVACPCLQPAQYRPATAYRIKPGKSGTRRSPVPHPRTTNPRREYAGISRQYIWLRGQCQGIAPRDALARHVSVPVTEQSGKESGPKKKAGQARDREALYRPRHSGRGRYRIRPQQDGSRTPRQRRGSRPPRMPGTTMPRTASDAARHAKPRMRMLKREHKYPNSVPNDHRPVSRKRMSASRAHDAHSRTGRPVRALHRQPG